MYKPIQIDDETKHHISIVLKYYRNSQKIKQSDFIRYNGVSVCSADTYSRIENGKVIKRNSIYSYLLYQINATYECFPAFWKQQQPKFHQLLRALNAYDLAAYSATCLQIQENLRGSRDFLAREVVLFLDISIAYFDKRVKLKDEVYNKYIEIFSIFPESLRDIVKTMLYQSAFYHHRDLGLCKQVFYDMQMENSSTAFIRIDQCREYFFEGRYLDSFAIALQLEDLFVKEKNYQRLLDVYELILFLYQKVQTNENIQMYMIKFFNLIQDHSAQFHPIKYKQGLFLAGIMYYYQNNGKEAYNCLAHLIEVDKNHYLPAALFMNIMVKQGVYDGALLLHPILHKETYPPYIVAFYQYFLDHHHHCNVDALENLLVKQVLPYCSPNDMLYWVPLKEELLSLIKDTKHYYIKKKLGEFSDEKG